MLPGRRIGYAIVLPGARMATGVPALHLAGTGLGRAIARSPGGLSFLWTLFGLGARGAFPLVLATRGTWRLRRGPDRAG